MPSVAALGLPTCVCHQTSKSVRSAIMHEPRVCQICQFTVDTGFTSVSHGIWIS
jgi:hypothetical protein